MNGTHVLPLDMVANEYHNDKQGFLDRGLELRGEKLDYGDASIQLNPFPRIPISVLLWEGDEEFPARCKLLFDSTSKLHLPADVLWSTAMMTLLIMLRDTDMMKIIP